MIRIAVSGFRRLGCHQAWLRLVPLVPVFLALWLGAARVHSQGKKPAPPAAAQEADTRACTASGFGTVHHPVRTSSAEAQKMFDRGMALDYGFNHN